MALVNSSAISAGVDLLVLGHVTGRKRIWDDGSSRPASLGESPRPSVDRRSTIRCKSCKSSGPCLAKRNRG